MKKLFCCSAKQKKKSYSNYQSPEKQRQSSNETYSYPISQPQFQEASPPRKLYSKIVTDSTTEKPPEKNSSFSTQITNLNQEQQFQHLEDSTLFIEKLRSSRKNPNTLKEEQQYVEKLINCSQKKNYLVEINWAVSYTFYLKGSQIQQTQIQNNLLLANPVNDLSKSFAISNNNQNSILKIGIKQSIDYVLLNQITWNFIQKLYGGGPEIFLQDEEEYNYSIIYEQDLHKYESLKNLKQINLQPIGLSNSRFYCYMNSVLQCLMSLNQLNYYIINQAKIFSENKKKFELTSAYSDLLVYIKSIENHQNPILQATKLQQLVEKKFDRNEQHDCHEFLVFFLSQILEEIQIGKPLQNTFKNHKEALNYYCRQNQNFINQLFMGQLTSVIKCPKCNQLSEQYDPFFDLSLPIESNVYRCLLKYFQDEILEEGWCCEKCSQKSQGIRRQTKITFTPNILILHFKRFEMTRNYANMRKLKDAIIIDSTLDLSEQYGVRFTTSEVKSMKYQMHAAIVHQGSVEKGHYYAFAKKENQWFHFDDDEVSQIQYSDILKNNQTYLLFYSKIIQ